MQPFELITVNSVPDAVKAQAASPTAQQGAQVRFIAGGTNLVDYMKLNIETPRQLVDINGLSLDKVEPESGGGLKIGALATNTDVANHEAVKAQYAVLSQAILSGASTQLRNMATTAGNLLQKTRCMYYRDTASACNKRQPGSGCSAIGGHNRMLAILGTSDHCIASNPSDQNVALAALEATIHVTGLKGDRAIPIAEFYTLPGNTPERETVLEAGDLVTHITIPALPAGTKSLYLKLRDRASFEFALASAAIVVKKSGDRIEFVRVAMGGVGNFRAAAEAALRGARPQSQNGFKVELAKRCLVHALTQATA
jgi:xanthine dehydrogenase YagS FAD-binding subunit